MVCYTETELLMKKTIFILLSCLIFLLALFPRSVEVLNKNYLFTFDQGRDYSAVKRIVVDKKLTLIGAEIGAGSAGISYVFHGPFYYYFLAVPFAFLKGDPYGGLILMFLFSIASVCLGFYFAKKILGLYAGLLMMLLMAISPPLISQARFVWSPHPAVFFILLAFLFVYLMSKLKPKYTFFAAFFTAFIYNFELAIAVPLSLSVLLYSLFIFRRSYLKQYVYLLTGFIVGYLPMVLFEVKHGFKAINSLLTYITRSPNNHSENISYFQNIYNHSGAFTYGFFDAFPRQTLIPNLLIALIILGSFSFLITKEKNVSIKKFFLFIALLPFITLFVFGFLRNPVYQYYLIHLTVSYVSIVVYSLYQSVKLKYFNLLLLLSIIILIFTFNAITNSYTISIRDLKDEGGIAKIKGKIETMDYIYKDANGQKFGVFIFSPPVYTYPYDYLLWWYGKRKYNYLPYSEKKGLVYLWIEPDYYKEWSYKGWLSTVIKTGKIIETKELSNGFIVQKRLW